MRRFTRSRRSATTLIAGLTAVVIAAGAAYATTSGGPHIAAACTSSANGELYLASPCRAGDRTVTLGIGAPAGPRGKTGPKGKTGPQGKTGQIGPKGDTGAQGATGQTGQTGAQGIQGVPGVPGPPGTLSSAYLDAYSSANRFGVNNGALIAFDTHTAAPVGITASFFNTTFTVTSAGTYLITVAVGDGGTGASVQLHVNGSAVGPSLPSPGTPSVSFSRIINLNAADAITVVQTGANNAAVFAGSGITIVRIA